MKLSYDKNDPLFKAGFEVTKILQDQGFQAFWVGGIVRNIILKRKSDNVDIATDAMPEEVEKVLAKQGIKVKPVGIKFGSLLAIVNKFPVEITTFRAEGRYTDNRHPDQVQYIKDYKEDVKRRDFTVNALYFDPIKIEILDPANGHKDLKGKLLKFVGDPKKRIDEDGLRMLRGVRLATQLGFKLEKNSFAAIKTRAKYIQDISGERIKAELDKILLSENRAEGIKLLDSTGLLRFILPELVILKNVFHKSKLFHMEGSIFTHTMMVLASIKSDSLELLYAALFHDIGKVTKPVRVFKKGEWRNSFRGHAEVSAEIFQKFATKYKFSKESRTNITWLVTYHDSWKDFSEMKQATQIKLVTNKNFPLLIEITKADDAGNIRNKEGTDEVKIKRSHLYLESQKLLSRVKVTESLQKKLANGNLIMKYANLKPGIQLGKKIESVKTQIILGKIKNESDLKKFL